MPTSEILCLLLEKLIDALEWLLVLLIFGESLLQQSPNI